MSCTQSRQLVYTLHDTVSCQQGYLGLLTCLGLVSTHRSHCLCTPLLHTTSSLHTFTAHNTSSRDCTQMSCLLLVKMPSLAQHRRLSGIQTLAACTYQVKFDRLTCAIALAFPAAEDEMTVPTPDTRHLTPDTSQPKIRAPLWFKIDNDLNGLLEEALSSI